MQFELLMPTAKTSFSSAVQTERPVHNYAAMAALPRTLTGQSAQQLALALSCITVVAHTLYEGTRRCAHPPSYVLSAEVPRPPPPPPPPSPRKGESRAMLPAAPPLPPKPAHQDIPLLDWSGDQETQQGRRMGTAATCAIAQSVHVLMEVQKSLLTLLAVVPSVPTHVRRVEAVSMSSGTPRRCLCIVACAAVFIS